MSVYECKTVTELLGGNPYPGRGILIGTTPDGKKAAAAYFIMGRSANSRNRVFVTKGNDVFTEPYDPAKVVDPSLIIYAAVRDVEGHLIVTNGNQTDTVKDGYAEGKSFEGSIHVNGYGDVLSLNPDGLQKLRSTVAYIQQRDDYSAMGNIQVRDILSESADAHGRKALTSAEVNDLIDEWIPRRSDNSRVFDAKSKPARFSGGEQRLLSILSVIATRHDAELMLIDEPLNNLDYVNARNISNMINRAIKENPRMGILMVSHCRIFPFITREIKLTSDVGIIIISFMEKSKRGRLYPA